MVATLFKAQLQCDTNLKKLSTYLPAPCFNQALLKWFQITNRHMNTVTAVHTAETKREPTKGPKRDPIVHEKRGTKKGEHRRKLDQISQCPVSIMPGSNGFKLQTGTTQRLMLQLPQLPISPFLCKNCQFQIIEFASCNTLIQ